MNDGRLIAVVGAGIAGVTCAAALHKAGFKTSLFDKSGGPAGRMSTRRGDGWQCDHGARYFTASHPAFKAEVARWQQAGVAGLWMPRMQGAGETASGDPAPDAEKYVGIPRMTSPAHFVCAGLALSPNTTVTRLERRSDGWHLLSAEQGWLAPAFDRVMLALPAPQAMSLLQQPAPTLAAVAGSVVMRGCWTLMLRFAAPFDRPFDAAFIDDSALRWVARDTSKPGRAGAETWVAQASAEWSEAHLERDSACVAQVLQQAFARLGAPQPQAWTAHRWRFADTGQPLQRACAWEPASGLGLCGDWLNDGTVQGAWLTGTALAYEVAQSAQG